MVRVKIRLYSCKYGRFDRFDRKVNENIVEIVSSMRKTIY